MSRTAPCQRHPDKPSERECTGCGGLYCAFCTVRKPRPDVTHHECPVCGSKGRLTAAKAVASAGNLAGELKSVFTYPVAGGAWMALVGAAIMGALIGILLRLGGFMLPMFAIPLALALFGFMWKFLLNVVASTADGEDELPDWPAYNGLAEFVLAALVLIGLILMCGLPAIAAWYLGVRSMTVLLTIVALGMTYFPMAMLVLAMGGNLSSLSPLVIIPSIIKVGRGYWVAVGALLAIMFIRLLVQRAVGDDAGFLISLLMSAVGLYFLVAQARVVGLLYRVYERQLGWFE